MSVSRLTISLLCGNVSFTFNFYLIFINKYYTDSSEVSYKKMVSFQMSFWRSEEVPPATFHQTAGYLDIVMCELL